MLGVDAQVKLFMYKSSYDFYPGMPQNIKKKCKNLYCAFIHGLAFDTLILMNLFACCVAC